MFKPIDPRRWGGSARQRCQHCGAEQYVDPIFERSLMVIEHRGRLRCMPCASAEEASAAFELIRVSPNGVELRLIRGGRADAPQPSGIPDTLQ